MASRTARDANDEPVGELRLDPLTGEWVNIVGHRQARPNLPTHDCNGSSKNARAWTRPIASQSSSVILRIS